MATRVAKGDRPIRVGVVGVSRGMSFANTANEHVGMKLVALCGQDEASLARAADRLPDVTTYADYDQFLSHDMDAVVLANFFHQHAPFAIKALDAGYHVMSEISACKTLGEAAALIRAVERSGKTYLFAENCCYMAVVQEMRWLYQAGEIGEARLAEGEYIHPASDQDMCAISPGVNHWRNWIPSTYYCTHALGPVMYVTDAMPVSVNAHSIDSGADDRPTRHARRGDPGSVILCRMSNGSTAILNGLCLRGHSLWYRFHGSRGLMENLRHGDRSMLRIEHEAWDRGPTRDDQAPAPTERMYRPDFPTHADLAAGTGHDGADFFMNLHFAHAIRTGTPPWLDVYRGVAMSVVGIQAWKSALDQGAPFEIPDFTKEAVRQRYEHEQWSPFPEDAGPDQPPPSITGMRPPTRSQLAAARQVWREQGYTGP